MGKPLFIVGNHMSDMKDLSKNRLNEPATVIGLGLLIFMLQFSFVALVLDTVGPYNLAGMWITIPDFAERLNDMASSLERVFTRLNGWDGQWYFHIAQNGYSCPSIPAGNNPNVCNVAFFPLVPMLGALVSQLGIDLVYAMPLVSQTAWLSTIMLLLFFVRSVMPLQLVHILVILLLVSYPGALYGFVSYSESLLTCLMLSVTVVAYSYLTQPRAGLLWLLALLGALSCLTKVSGVVVLGIPVLMALLHPNYHGKWFSTHQVKVYLASVAGLGGLLLFFVYCQLTFNDWALYFRYVGSSWGGGEVSGLRYDPLSVFANFTWHQHIPVRISNLVIVTLPAAILLLFVAMIRRRPQLYFLFIPVMIVVAFLYYFYSTLGNFDRRNYDIARQMLPVVAFMTLLAMLWIKPSQHRGRLSLLVVALLTVIALQFYAQFHMLDALTVGGWVS